MGSVAREALLGLVVEGDDRTVGLAIERLAATAEAAEKIKEWTECADCQKDVVAKASAK